jgi:hypothetical protein
MNKYAKQLQIIKSKKLSLAKAKSLGIDIQELRHRGFIIVSTIKNESITVPKGVPKYAARFGFTRRKYGLEVKINEETQVKITDKGIKFLAKSVKKPVEEEQEDKQKTIDIEVDNEDQDQQSV